MMRLDGTSPGIVIWTSLVLAWSWHAGLYGQTSAHPTPPPGVSSVTPNPETGEFLFKLDDRVIYRYRSSDDPRLSMSGATLHAITAVAPDGTSFYPSNAGGINAELDGSERNPWSSGVTYERLARPVLVGDTVITSWRMTYEEGEFIEYEFRLSLRGRTLTIEVASKDDTRRATGLTLDRSEDTPGARVIRVPYLTLFNIMLVPNEGASEHGVYTSFYFDWEKSHSSSITPFQRRDYRRSSRSVSFSSSCRYLPLTNGKRNHLKETIYLTVSPDLHDVLPNLPGPVAPFKDALADKIVVSYNPPFPWLMHPFDPPTYNFIDSLYGIGLRDVALIVKNWQRGQFDHQYPNVLPPNSFDVSVCNERPFGGNGGLDGLLALRRKVVDVYGYEFGLHENYVDYYTDAGSGQFEYDPTDEALLPNGSAVEGWRNCNSQVSHVLKPSVAPSYATHWSEQIRDQINPTWSYLDVHSAIDPARRVDFDSRSDGAGMYSYTVKQYREVAARLRNSYRGPVQGEGHRQFLYAGYFDDFEGRLYTADESLSGVKAPLLVDFDLLKIRPKSMQHGVGHIHSFLNVKRLDTLTVSLFQYLATELAYGHGGLISKALVRDHSLRQAVLENAHVLPIQKAYAGAMPLEQGGILYSDGGPPVYSASEYIARHHDFDDITSSGFMGRVKITYENGVIVCVNRSSRPWSVSDIGTPGGWFAYNAVEGLDTGRVSSTTFTLKPYGGWVCYNPFESDPDIPLISSTDQPSPVSLRWTKAVGARMYHLEVGTDPDFEDPLLLADPSGNRFEIPDLPPSTTFFWRVRSVNETGRSDWSETGRFETGARRRDN